MKTKIRIGTRGSALALWQADHVERLIKQANPQIEIERIIIKTEGDRDQKSSLTRIGGQGVFTKTIEDALLNGKIDIAVHSLKDLPSAMAEGLQLAAIPERGPVEDVLVTPDGKKFEELQNGARIATGSIRRRCQLLHLRPDLKMEDLRGNIHTRLKKMVEQNLDGIIMARAALVRLEIKEVNYQVFSTEQMLPAIGQGAIGIQIRKDDVQTQDLLKEVNHEPTYWSVTAERSLLRTLDTGCQFPVGALATVENDVLTLNGFVGNHDGSRLIRDSIQGEPEKAFEIGVKLAERLIEKGAREILNQFRTDYGT